ncbi:MAG: DUF2007 domain-containing protein [Clostridia bacterium]|nr:DUF2007 domain-containing protein [Clostridia bacterium]
MKTCHVCGFACENDAEICALCGAELKTFEMYEQELKEAEERKAKEAAEEALIIKKPVLAASVDNVVAAEIYKDVLRDNGIVFTCDESDDAMQIVFGGGFSAVEIYVNEEDLEIAQQLYENVVNAQMDFGDEEFDDFEDFEEE